MAIKVQANALQANVLQANVLINIGLYETCAILSCSVLDQWMITYFKRRAKMYRMIKKQ